MGKNNEFLELNGIVEELLPSTTFKVKLDDGREILTYLSGRMRLHKIRLLPGDKVKIEMSPYDLTKGRIIYRY
ncbi:MAG: translation initiation factor IF-1 [Parcubacteria group bacterium Athens1014_10]|nr:MAG: translation initiation factor IF-1 [Parcubacteria group bacterium Athens1014_10]TSD06060.1 MAG: translation initiation factor IF-1 [Parcubacteria group bacterium Athens0714_12]